MNRTVSVKVEVGGIYAGCYRDTPSWRRRNPRKVLRIEERFGAEMWVLWELNGGSFYRSWELLSAFEEWVKERVA